VKRASTSFGPTVLALCGLIAATSLATGAAIGISWSKSEVIPVVLVKPGIGGFEPTEGSSIGNTWTKDEVKAVVLVTPGIGGFQPTEGSSIGNIWPKDETVPVMLVEPTVSGFVPSRALSGGSELAGYASPAVPQLNETAHLPPAGALPSVIETQIDGDFEGWEGETIVKTTDGHIWQQSSYYYEYHYAFMPKALIFRAGDGYKMKVDGVSEPVAIKQLK
jgi:hypothetical protein